MSLDRAFGTENPAVDRLLPANSCQIVSFWPECEVLQRPPYGRNKRQSGPDANIAERPSLTQCVPACHIDFTSASET